MAQKNRSQEALIQAAKELTQARGLNRHPRGFKGLREVRDAWREGLCEERWVDRFAACFDIEATPSFARYLQGAFKDLGGSGRASGSIDLLDLAQAQLLGYGAWSPAMALERLREQAEKGAGKALSPHGLSRGSIPTQPSPWKELAEARSPLAAWLCPMLRNARVTSVPIDSPLLRASQGGREVGMEEQRVAERRAFELLEMDASGLTLRANQSMEMAKRCDELARDLMDWRKDEEFSPCPVASSLASFTGRLCVRLMRGEGDGAWLFDVYGIVWDGEQALKIEGQGVQEPLPEFWSAMESESLAEPLGSALAAPRSKSRSL